MKRLFAVALLAGLLSACSTPAPLLTQIDRSVVSVSQEPRIQFLILHYTAINEPASLRVLSQRDVSAHYLVGDQNPVKVWQLVDESRMAYHAGLSEWKGYSRLNASSVGIEIVNQGFQDTPQGRVYFPFPQAQIDQVIALSKDIVKRYNIKPEFVLGHSDIAPSRKQDPGPLFPWKQFADAGLIIWPNADEVARLTPVYTQQLPEARWFQQKLAKIGYGVPQSGQFDDATRNVIIAFQTKYRPAKFDGMADAETAAMIDSVAAQTR
ncbi:N-acetylmuramoyl-L-alanine amidase [Undibacterium luofuense]|uniref:N-acetylmuramoyl-L-alanine amidase n=2 Tax=Undibacterium luofuense TaxID=2828733 RepID=A0A941DLA3_9BURK|nr:N-acetylmuramoyl-L-alanine amidase [Undibacterium luofuense]MBR7783167.1 N-acetylmuramoyl-L-alanine amidase [Undibacterium luofuense]